MKSETVKKLINVLLLTIFVTSAITLAGCSRQERKVEEKKRLTLEIKGNVHENSELLEV